VERREEEKGRRDEKNEEEKGRGDEWVVRGRFEATQWGLEVGVGRGTEAIKEPRSEGAREVRKRKREIRREVLCSLLDV
jgi:hypothetical protein